MFSIQEVNFQQGAVRVFYRTDSNTVVTLGYVATVKENVVPIKRRLSKETPSHVGQGAVTFSLPPHVTRIKMTLEGQPPVYFPPHCIHDFESALAPSLTPLSLAKRPTYDLCMRLVIKENNQLAVDTSGLDHTPLAAGVQGDSPGRIFGHQLGPHRASRAMAMVHLAMLRAGDPFIAKQKAKAACISAVAITTAVNRVLSHLFPSHAPRLDLFRQRLVSQVHSLARRRSGKTKAAAWVKLGEDHGTAVAQAIIEDRANDGSNHSEQRYGVDYIPSNDGQGAPEGGEWTQDPISRHPLALGSLWSTVKPFVIPSADFARCPPPPALPSREFAMQFDEVKCVGGDAVNTPTVRSAEMEEQGIFWAYDGTPSLCAPPRLYNQIAMTISDTQGCDTVKLLRMLAALNVSLADTGLAAWESKWHYKLWRPITAIRYAAALAEQGHPLNEEVVGDANWTPLGAPHSNTNKGNFTPPFPAYPSGHAAFGGATFQVLRHFFDENVPFTFVSDEFNGVTTGLGGEARPHKPRTYMNFSQAEEENGQSRMYLGIHFGCDKSSGITQGRTVANVVLSSDKF